MNRRMNTPVSSRVSAQATASSPAKTESNGYCSVETVRGTAGRDGRVLATSLTREGLLRLCRASCARIDPAALAALAALPEHIGRPST